MLIHVETLGSSLGERALTAWPHSRPISSSIWMKCGRGRVGRAALSAATTFCPLAVTSGYPLAATFVANHLLRRWPEKGGAALHPRPPRPSARLAFEASPAGSRQGKLVIVQHHDISDPETGGAFTLKQYLSEKELDDDGEPRNFRISLKPLNAEFEPIVLTPDFEHDVQVIAELRTVLGVR